MSGIIISSSGAAARPTLRQVCERGFNTIPFYRAGVKTGMPVLYIPPKLGPTACEFGGCLREIWPLRIVVDFGTATLDRVSTKSGTWAA